MEMLFSTCQVYVWKSSVSWSKRQKPSRTCAQQVCKWWSSINSSKEKNTVFWRSLIFCEAKSISTGCFPHFNVLIPGPKLKFGEETEFLVSCQQRKKRTPLARSPAQHPVTDRETKKRCCSVFLSSLPEPWRGVGGQKSHARTPEIASQSQSSTLVV